MLPRTLTVLVAVLMLTAGAPLFASSAEASTQFIGYRADPIPYRPIPLTDKATKELMTDNHVTGALSLNFTTTFYEESTSLFWIGANGFITMLTPPQNNGCCQGQLIPDQNQPNGLVAGFWTDLDPSVGTVRWEPMNAPAGSPPNATKVLVVEWANVTLKQDPIAILTFQIQIYDSGHYEFHWKDVDTKNGAALATIGIESESGTRATLVEHGRIIKHTLEAIRLTPVPVPAPPPRIDFVSPSEALPGQTVSIMGGDFLSSDVVSIGGVNTTSFFIAPDRIDAVVPNIPEGSVDVAVTHTDGQTAVLVDGLVIRPPLDPNRTTYRVTEIALALLDLGTNATAVALGDEESSGEISLGFTTRFFDDNVSSLWIVSNGFLGFLQAPNASEFAGAIRTLLPDARVPNALLAGFWTDLNPAAGGSIRFATLPAPPASSAGQVFVVEFRDVPLFDDPTQLQTFQVHVYDNGLYEVHVQRAATGLDLGVVGIENGPGDTGATAFAATGAVLTQAGFRFTPGSAGAILAVSGVSPSSGPPGAQVDIAGTGFLLGATVSIGGVSAASTFVSDTLLQATVPTLSDGVVDVTVTNPDGVSATLADAFVVASETDSTGDSNLTILFASPSEGRAGDAFTVVGSGFDLGSRVFLGALAAPTTFVSSTRLKAIVPDGAPAGATTLRVVNASGGSASLSGGFTVLVGPRVDAVTSNVRFQGEIVGIVGSGFEANFTLLLGSREVRQAIRVSSTLLEAIVPTDLPGDLYDVTVFGSGRSSTLSNALLVKERADAAVLELGVSKPRVQTDLFTLPLDAVLGQRVTATVTNLGDETAQGVVVDFTARSDERSVDPFSRPAESDTAFARVTIGALAPGERREVSANWSAPGVGDYVIGARVALAGTEFRTTNNLLETRTFSALGGVRGASHCDVLSAALGSCALPSPLPNKRRTTTNNTEATDTHSVATLAFNVTMRTPRFDFVDPDRIFSTSSEHPDGSTTECTVWRFFGGRGSMSFRLLEGDGLGGRVVVPTALNRTSDGKETRQTTTSTYVLGVEVESKTTPPNVRDTQPRTNYTYEPPEWVELELEASILKGDFAQCTFTSPEGKRTEMFTYAALPSNLEQRAPRFTGIGTVQHVSVSYHVSKSESSRAGSPPPGALPIG